MLIVYSSITGIVIGTINYLYFRKQGYTSISVLILGIFAFTGIAYTFLKTFI
jgi:hypothetical protein